MSFFQRFPSGLPKRRAAGTIIFEGQLSEVTCIFSRKYLLLPTVSLPIRIF